MFNCVLLADAATDEDLSIELICFDMALMSKCELLSKLNGEQ